MARSLRARVADALAARSDLLSTLDLRDGPGGSRVAAWAGDGFGLTGRLTGLHGDRMQLLVNPFGAHPRALVDAWLRHALWTASVEGADDRTTVLLFRANDDWRATRVVLDRPAAAAIGHALVWSQRIRSEPLPLFPHVMPRVIAEGRKADPFDRDLALAELENCLEEGEPWSASSSGSFAYRILWRSGLPDAGRILDIGLDAYRPIFGAIDRSSTISAFRKLLGTA